MNNTSDSSTDSNNSVLQQNELNLHDNDSDNNSTIEMASPTFNTNNSKGNFCDKEEYANGKCEDESNRKVVDEVDAVLSRKMAISFHIIQAPVVCPPGYAPDRNGKCRPIYS